MYVSLVTINKSLRCTATIDFCVLILCDCTHIHFRHIDCMCRVLPCSNICGVLMRFEFVFELAPKNGLKRNQTTNMVPYQRRSVWLCIYLQKYPRENHTTENCTRPMLSIGCGKFLVGHGTFSVKQSGHMVCRTAHLPCDLTMCICIKLPRPTNICHGIQTPLKLKLCKHKPH